MVFISDKLHILGTAVSQSPDMYICTCALSRVGLWDPMDCSLPGSSVHGIFQARKLEWIAISSSRESSRPGDRTHISCVSCICRRILYHRANLMLLLNNSWCQTGSILTTSLWVREDWHCLLHFTEKSTEAKKGFEALLQIMPMPRALLC